MGNPADKTKITVQVDEGVDVLVVLEPNTTGTPDPTSPINHKVKKESPTTGGYSRSYRWNAAGCS